MNPFQSLWVLKWPIFETFSKKTYPGLYFEFIKIYVFCSFVYKHNTYSLQKSHYKIAVTFWILGQNKIQRQQYVKGYSVYGVYAG